MAKSKLRNGAKAHKKRVVNRNSKIKSEVKKQQNLFHTNSLLMLMCVCYSILIFLVNLFYTQILPKKNPAKAGFHGFF